MNLLAIDSTTSACSVALNINNNITYRYQVGEREHANLLLSMIDELCADSQLTPSQLDAIAFTKGPGSFTGLRISASIVQGIAVSHQLLVIPISSLQVMAQRAFREVKATKVMPILDAKMGEVYWSYYETVQDVMKCRDNDYVSKPGEIPLQPSEEWLAVGEGCRVINDYLKSVNKNSLQPAIIDFFPHAYDVAYLGAIAYAQGQGLPAEQALPVYLQTVRFKQIT